MTSAGMELFELYETRGCDRQELDFRCYGCGERIESADRSCVERPSRGRGSAQIDKSIIVKPSSNSDASATPNHVRRLATMKATEKLEQRSDRRIGFSAS